MYKRSLVRNAITCALFLIMLTTAAADTTAPRQGTESPITQDERMQWWREARFGMFVHWGLYSVLGGEWNGKDYGKERGGADAGWVMKKARISKNEYAKLAQQFNPVKFDAKEWVSLAKDAGMKYIVINSKHHDGFCLFDTEHTDYNVVDATPFQRDIIEELADECAKQGIKFGVYYSQFQDWYHKGLRRGSGLMSGQDYHKMVQGHLDELLTGYGDISVLWFDTGGNNVEAANSQGAKVRKLAWPCPTGNGRCTTSAAARFVSPAGQERSRPAARRTRWPCTATYCPPWWTWRADRSPTT